MNKDIEWLKEEIEEDIKSWGGGNPDYFRGASDAYENVKDWLNQLDEPEVTLDKAFEKVAESYLMPKEDIWRHLEWLEAHGGKVTYGEPEVLSQEFIDKYKVDYGNWVPSVPIVHLENLLVPTLSKKVQLSQKTADELNRYRERGYSLKDLLVVAGTKQAQEKLARAWLDGYTVEKHPKLLAKIKGWEQFVDFVGAIYWGTDADTDRLTFVDRDQALALTKKDWEQLGVTEKNADFNNQYESE